MLNEHAHPTARSALRVVQWQDETMSFSMDSHFDQDQASILFREISAVALFVCFAFRNACVDESVLDPEWRKALKYQAEQLLDQDMPHLERDWDHEKASYDKLRLVRRV